MERKKFIEYIDKLLEQSDAWRKDAEKREDWNSACFYQGEVKAYEKVKRLVNQQLHV
ncbi:MULTISPECIES: hypothetical protein [Priestia]|jgi:hypothetical protein|nr:MULTISPECIES: hypothetical protein [Priestia]MBU8753954.1 hypothetical protein [Priestia megaterium]MBY0198729.1 hypothetical protein [Priestia megaterium]MCE4090807.1 hypothetical protein [Priestia megaterium]MCR8929584.1 hypothetical protein [Priestia megaterium]MCU7712847.1 hypothetical protein [Priestia megaterium]